MAVAFGGAGLMSLLATARPDIRSTDLLRIATIYERAFWAAAGVLVMTGVGNLGAFGAQLPSRDSAWGITLLAKLALVVVLMLASVPRTLVVVQLGVLEDSATPRIAPLLARLYLMTLGGLVVISALAVWLSHG
jgi:putative copper export protein